MKYEFGLVNYFLHELGDNLSNESIAIKNENKMFDNKLTNKERISREINKIKDKTDKYNDYLDVDNKNIKEIIVCIDLLLGIEISFKTTFILVASDILENDNASKVLDLKSDSFENTIKESDKIFRKIIKNYLDKICT